MRFPATISPVPERPPARSNGRSSSSASAPDVVRRVSIAMYEGEINMVIHAGGGEADVEILPDRVSMVLTDHGPGIPDVELAMQAGWSTAPDNVRNLGFGAGMGLPNIKKYTDDFDIHSEVGKGTTLSITVYAGKESL